MNKLTPIHIKELQPGYTEYGIPVKSAEELTTNIF